MRNQQSGLVLFVALIFLLVITILGVALLSNSAMDAKMAGAVSDRTDALQAGNGVLGDVMKNANTSRAFLQDLTAYPHQVDTSLTDSSGNARQATVEFKQESSCPRSRNGSSSDVFICRHFTDSADITFGRHQLGQLEVVNGVSQPLISPTGS